MRGPSFSTSGTQCRNVLRNVITEMKRGIFKNSTKSSYFMIYR